MTMQYHTDYIIGEKDMPGPKFFLTTTMYINDDYDGGDVEFFVDDKYYPYKPEAGDILIFPSTEPYYHGVKTIKNGNKFFIRNFIQYYYEGSEEWLKNQRYFGAVNWMKKETERLEKETRSNMKYSDRKNMQ
jgi:predicted 2-oxoglutarate/Fe(II)-dependent dioxygenase YbiX